MCVWDGVIVILSLLTLPELHWVGSLQLPEPIGSMQPTREPTPQSFMVTLVWKSPLDRPVTLYV